jgi:hypothetical protein
MTINNSRDVKKDVQNTRDIRLNMKIFFFNNKKYQNIEG